MLVLCARLCAKFSRADFRAELRTATNREGPKRRIKAAARKETIQGTVKQPAMNNNAATGSYHDDLMVYGGELNCGLKKSSVGGKGESRKSTSTSSAAAASAAVAAAAAAGNPRLQQWLKETERQREENNRAAFSRWMEKCDSGLVKPSTLQNYPTAAAAALRAQPSGAAVAAAAAAAANKRHHQQLQQRPPSPGELDCGPDGSQFAAVLGNALLHHHSAGGQQHSQQPQMQSQQQQQMQPPPPPSQTMLDPGDCGPLGYPMYMYATGYGPYQPAAFCYQPAGPHHQQSTAQMPPQMHSQQHGGYMSMPQMPQHHHHGYGLLHLGGPGGGGTGGGRVCQQSGGASGPETGAEQSQGPQGGGGFFSGPEDSPEAAAAAAGGGGGPGDLQQHLCGDFSGMAMCHVLQRQA